MIQWNDAVAILKAGGFTELQATQYCGRNSSVSVRSICSALEAKSGKAKSDTPINWVNDPDAIVEDDEPQIGRDYA